MQLPEAASAEPEAARETRMIEIDAAGTFYYEEKAVSLSALREKLAGLAKETDILLRADKTVQLQRFIDVADVLKQLQFTQVAVQTQSRTEAGDP